MCTNDYQTYYYTCMYNIGTGWLMKTKTKFQVVVVWMHTGRLQGKQKMKLSDVDMILVSLMNNYLCR